MDFEQDLRDSLQHSADALGTGDGSLESVRSRGRRRKAWKAIGSAFAVVLVVGVGALGLAAVLNSGIEVPVAESTVVSTQAPVTTEALTTTPETSAPQPTVGTSAYPVPFVLEADDEVLVVGTDGVEQVLYAGRYVAVASDGAGGLVFQQEIAVEDQSRDRGTIYRVPSGTTEPQVLIEQGEDHVIFMHGVEDVDGVPTLLYTDRTGAELPETAQTVLVAYDLVAGGSRELGVVGGWESGIRTVSYGGGLYVMDASAESEVRFRYLDVNGNEYAPAFDPHPGCEAGDVRCPEVPVMSPTGELVFVRHRFIDTDGAPIDLVDGEWVIVNDQGIVVSAAGEETIIADFQEIVEIVAHDLDTGEARVLYSYEPGRDVGMDGAAFVELDFDGRYLAVHDRRGKLDAPVLIVDTTTEEVSPNGNAAVPRFPLAPFDLPGVVTSPFE